ncbi:hypothetical protein WJX73_005900 [Symbiochloris irregularis]|uniref:Uncharacterized protein n=1 Tax=Symbiochloris irregularis TaxID=706552 RepID=A0AAW1P7G7_9CHLO
MWIHDFVRDLIIDNMEDPKVRDKRTHEHIEKVYKAAQKAKFEWSQPTKPWGFWQSDFANSSLIIEQDPAFKRLAGRTLPLDGR